MASKADQKELERLAQLLLDKVGKIKAAGGGNDGTLGAVAAYKCLSCNRPLGGGGGVPLERAPTVDPWATPAGHHHRTGASASPLSPVVPPSGRTAAAPVRSSRSPVVGLFADPLPPPQPAVEVTDGKRVAGSMTFSPMMPPPRIRTSTGGGGRYGRSPSPERSGRRSPGGFSL